ncbi:MAG: B12-binding domain-containing protein [Candidatus Hodarchaeota archaeon]
MTEKSELFDEISNALLALDRERVLELTKQVLAQKIDPVEAIEKGFAKGMEVLGELFEKREFYIAELAYAAAAMEDAMAILEPEILQQKEKRSSRKRILIGTVEGDIHSLGKNLVRTMLMTAGFEVIDLGTDVPSQEFVEKVKELNPVIVSLSALMTTTMLNQHKVIRELERNGLRDRVKILIGGAPVTDKFAQEIGADGYGENAIDAVRLVKTWFA